MIINESDFHLINALESHLIVLVREVIQEAEDMQMI